MPIASCSPFVQARRSSRRKGCMFHSQRSATALCCSRILGQKNPTNHMLRSHSPIKAGMMVAHDLYCHGVGRDCHLLPKDQSTGRTKGVFAERARWLRWKAHEPLSVPQPGRDRVIEMHVVGITEYLVSLPDEKYQRMLTVHLLALRCQQPYLEAAVQDVVETLLSGLPCAPRRRRM